MSDTPGLKAPRIHVVLEDGSEHNVQTDNRDLLQFDRTRVKHKWPSATDAPFVWLTFLAWHSLKREGLTALTLSDFEGVCLEVSAEDAEEVPPTPGDPEPDYS